MSARYIPPHLRRQHQQQQQPPSSSTAPENRNPSNGYTPLEIATHFNLSSKPGTLNATENDSGKLAFVLVFKDQHPDWHTEGKLFCKTNLHLLSLDPVISASEAQKSIWPPSASPSSISTHPIPIFTQLPRSNPHTYGSKYPHERQIPFTFAGYYKVTSLDHLLPRSPALIALLDRKFNLLGKKRTPDSWNASLSQKWAVVCLEKVDGEGELGDPMLDPREAEKSKTGGEEIVKGDGDK